MSFTVYQLDFIMADVKGDLNEEIYMELPEGFQNESDKICLLKKISLQFKTIWTLVQKIR